MLMIDDDVVRPPGPCGWGSRLSFKPPGAFSEGPSGPHYVCVFLQLEPHCQLVEACNTSPLPAQMVCISSFMPTVGFASSCARVSIHLLRQRVRRMRLWTSVWVARGRVHFSIMAFQRSESQLHGMGWPGGSSTCIPSAYACYAHVHMPQCVCAKADGIRPTHRDRQDMYAWYVGHHAKEWCVGATSAGPGAEQKRRSVQYCIGSASLAGPEHARHV